MREISMEEWNATPADYLVHPDHHPKLWGRAPGDSTLEDERAKLFAKHGRADVNPSTPGSSGHAHH
jgi:hypothetical protein